jgi:hypothetical protein
VDRQQAADRRTQKWFLAQPKIVLSSSDQSAINMQAPTVLHLTRSVSKGKLHQSNHSTKLALGVELMNSMTQQTEQNAVNK